MDRKVGMKILQITQYFRKNDAASIIVETITSELRCRGNSVVVATPDPLCEDSGVVGVSYGRLAQKLLIQSVFGRFFACSFTYLLLLPRLLVRGRDMDLIMAHHHNHHFAAATSFLLSRILRVRCCIFVHDLLTYGQTSSSINKVYDKIFFAANYAILKKADVVFVQSLGIKKCLRSQNVVVLPNCTSAGTFIRRQRQQVVALRKRLGIEDEKILLFLGTATKDRGLGLLVKSIGELVSMGCNVIALFVGRAPEMSGLHDLAIKLKVQDHLKFVGEVPHDEVPLYLQLSDVAVGPLALPPTLCTLPVKVLEYMAAEKPTIALKGSVPDELLIHGFNGLLLAEIDEAELTRDILYLLEKPDEARRIGKNARNYVLRNYDTKVIVNHLDHALHSMIPAFSYKSN
jgi:glycosyltransferase involved in cell wall biosynthesis